MALAGTVKLYLPSAFVIEPTPSDVIATLAVGSGSPPVLVTTPVTVAGCWANATPAPAATPAHATATAHNALLINPPGSDTCSTCVRGEAESLGMSCRISGGTIAIVRRRRCSSFVRAFFRGRSPQWRGRHQDRAVGMPVPPLVGGGLRVEVLDRRQRLHRDLAQC